MAAKLAKLQITSDKMINITKTTVQVQEAGAKGYKQMCVCICNMHMYDQGLLKKQSR